MTTVQQLIDQLMRVEDKSLPVMARDDQGMTMEFISFSRVPYTIGEGNFTMGSACDMDPDTLYIPLYVSDQ